MNNSLGLTAIILLLAVSSLSAATHYVSLGSTNPTPPYTNWVTAATNIQQAMNVAATNDAVLVTNGVYPGGVTVTKPLTLLSVNGPQFTVIDGGGTNRCVSLTDGASLTGFTLTNGHLSVAGGGVSCTSTNAFLTNCVITGNWGAVCSGGGGAYRGTLYDCTLSDNYGDYGGGAAYSTLYNCTLTGNSAEEGGGANHCTLYNCTLSTNSANWDGGGAVGCTLSNCTLSTNWATADGGGAYGGTLYNCALTGNRAATFGGGGANGCTLYNCTLTGNSANSDGGGAYGGTLYNCTLSGNSAEEGGGANRCTLYNCTLSTNSANWHGGGADGCMLYSCTLSTNWATADGGGAYGGTLYNCALTGNRAATFGGGGANGCTLYNCTLTGNSANSDGGGAFVSTLYNCTLTGNSANSDGGGAFVSTLYNCTLTGNSANSDGGGAFVSTLYNCIVYFNTSSGATNFDSSSILNYCCTTPLPTNGVGNITNAPFSANGNLRLQSSSPCINAGNNAYVTTTTDLDGRPRIVGGTVDMGAYECQSPALLDFYNWLQTYALSTSASSVYLDSDGDGMNNWQEWVCGTNPTNALSVLRLLSPSITSTNATVTWQSVAGVSYFLGRSTNLSAPFMLLASNLVGQASTTSYADTNGAGAGPFFYRVGVKSP